MSTSNIKTTKYVYKSSGGGSHLDVEYGTDLGALTRLEVSMTIAYMCSKLLVYQ